MYLDGYQSKRLRFRPVSLDDVELWSRFFEDPESTLYLPDSDLNNLERSKSWIERQLVRYRENRFGLHAVILKETGEFVGQVGLITQTVDGQDEIEIGYHLFTEHRGKGYATEAAIACKEFAVSKGYTDHIVSIIDKNNEASKKVAERNGMKPWKESSYEDLEVIVYRIDL